VNSLLSGANKLSFEALDCQGGMVGGGFTITFYKKASTSAPTVTFSAKELLYSAPYARRQSIDPLYFLRGQIRY